MKPNTRAHGACLALPLSALLLACGGGGGADSATPATPVPPPVAVDPFQGTAYLKVSETSRYQNKSYGMERSIHQLMVDQCNALRRGHYDLPPQQPEEAVMAGLDTQITERYFDTDKAATYTSGYVLAWPDLERWTAEFSRNNSVPAVPPDCSVYRKVPIQTGWLWRDGVRYELRFKDSKALGNRSSSTLSRTTLATAEQVNAMPSTTIMGERCHKPQVPLEGVVTGESCLWDRYPMVAYLNWPWSLSGKTTLGNGDQAIERQLTVLALERGKVLDAAKLALPAGFAVTLP
ncbi:hypothetical protein LNV23_16375 [Paucibacter sp. DJ1R-11]|uniref:hypothetical protein n=1 Tax=Paucibacter sp. DJ1R-11 TaxID=2893556 RepID=UPI0021E4FC05|nr:hypothetical protein [Paucibacter sp. DJ1R-11]MCV2365029.1 hypothetical protein [Paucibacter sp. DJ1R-11]